MYPEGTFFRVLKSIKLYPFMKKDFIQNAGERYESPECSVIAFGFEGVLCDSGFNSVYHTENFYCDEADDLS